MSQLPEIRFWHGEKPNVLLYSDIAEKCAECFHSAGRRKNRPTQLRRFYDEVITQADLLRDAGPDRFEMGRSYLHLLIAKAAYARGRNLVCDDFVSFVRTCVTQVDRQKDLQAFAHFFEAVMAFYKKLRPKDN